MPYPNRPRHPCPVCGTVSHLFSAPFPFEPQIGICADCTEKVREKVQVFCHEEGCQECPRFSDGYLDFPCDLDPFDLTQIGYDPARVYVEPRQISLFEEAA